MNQKINFNGKNPKKQTGNDEVYKKREPGSSSRYTKKVSTNTEGYAKKDDRNGEEYARKPQSNNSRYENKEAGSSEGYVRRNQGTNSRYESKEAGSSEGYVRRNQGTNSRYENKEAGSSESYARKPKNTNGRYTKNYTPRNGNSVRREIVKDERYDSDQEVKNEKYVNDTEVKNEKFLRNDSFNNQSASDIREDLVEGRNAVIEVLKSTKTVEQILVSKGDTEGSISVVLALAKERGIVVKEVDRKKLDSMSYTGVHQGVIAIVTPYNYFEVQDILNLAKERGEKPFIIVVDEIEDPHNLGSLIRTAEIVGAHGLIIPKRRNVGITPIVYKSSAGATSHMRIAKVSNINMAIKELKKSGVWIYGADIDGKDYCFNADLTGAVALVIGSEGRGISKLTKEKCDVLIKIPMVGKINSYNASVAGGILMYEVLKQKLQK